MRGGVPSEAEEFGSDPQSDLFADFGFGDLFGLFGDCFGHMAV